MMPSFMFSPLIVSRSGAVRELASVRPKKGHFQFVSRPRQPVPHHYQSDIVFFFTNWLAPALGADGSPAGPLTPGVSGSVPLSPLPSAVTGPLRIEHSLLLTAACLTCGSFVSIP